MCGNAKDGTSVVIVAGCAQNTGLQNVNSTMNKSASELGKLAAGKPKHYSKEELVLRTKRLHAGQKKYLLKKKEAAKPVANMYGGLDT